MKYSLPCLSLVFVALTGSAAAINSGAAAIAAESGDQLLMQAIGRLETHRSVAARLRHQVAIGKDQLFGVGSYWQQGSGENLRVRMELQIAGQDASLLQVSNSRFVWVDRRLSTGRTVTRIDLRQLRADPVLSASNLVSIKPGEASWSPIQPELTAHSGGLPSLLAALSENFAFLPPQAMRLAVAPPLASQPMNIPVFAVVGHWKPDKLSMIHSSTTSEPSVDGTVHDLVETLPARLPQEVLLLVGQTDLFPYRVEYRHLETALPATADKSQSPFQLSANPIAVLELSDVAYDVPIEGGQFDYSPRDVESIDQTAKLIERLRKQRQAQVANRNETLPAR
jgi:hypothetical protein